MGSDGTRGSAATRETCWDYCKEVARGAADYRAVGTRLRFPPRRFLSVRSVANV